MRRRWMWPAMVLGTWLLLELVALGGLTALREVRDVRYEPIDVSTVPDAHRKAIERLLRDRSTYIGWSATLGWTVRPGVVQGLYRSNLQGLRADREYSATPAPGITRIAAFGDSFTHGDDVPNDATWESVLERTGDDLEVLNFGVGAFGLDQALLRWRELGVGFRPHLVLIGWFAQDIGRQVNVYRPFYYPVTGLPLAKPRFVLRSGTLVLEPSPVARLEQYRDLLADPPRELRRLGAEDDHYRHSAHASALDLSALVRLLKVADQELVESARRPIRDGFYNERSEAWAVTTRIFDQFVAEVRAAPAQAIILLFPSQDDLRRRAAGNASVYRPLRDHLERRGYDVVDLLDAFPDCLASCDVEAIVPRHLSVAGNRVVGEFLAATVRDRIPGGSAAGGDDSGAGSSAAARAPIGLPER